MPIVLSTVSFFIILEIFALYRIERPWAILIAFLGITSISNYPFLEILNNLVTFDIDSIFITPGYFDLLSSFSSSLVLCIFLGLFFLSLRAQIIPSQYNKILPLLWATSVFIHPTLFIFGYPFIFVINFIQLRKAKQRREPINIYSFCAINIAPLLIAVPFIIYSVNFFSTDPQVEIASLNRLDIVTFFKAAFFYFAIPLISMLLSSHLFKVDPFELFVRFWPILLIALIEIFLRMLFLIHLLPIDDIVILDRVSIYFLHFFYYLPFLSIVTRKFTYLPNINDRKNYFFETSRVTLNFIFVKLSKPISISVFLLLSIIYFESINHNSYKEVNLRAQLLKDSLPKINSSKRLKGKKIYFFSTDEQIIVNFLFPSNTGPNVLLKDASSSNIGLDFLEHLTWSIDENIDPQRRPMLLDLNFDADSFFDNSRSLDLIYWLKYNDAYKKNKYKKMPTKKLEKLQEDFFKDSYIVSNAVIHSLNTDNINLIDVDNFKIYTSK